jgi:uncharacterized membrane protein
MHTPTILAVVLAITLLSSIVLTVLAMQAKRRERKRIANQQQVNKVLKKGVHYAHVAPPKKARVHLAQAQELDTKLLTGQDTTEADGGSQAGAQRRSRLYRFFFGP